MAGPALPVWLGFLMSHAQVWDETKMNIQKAKRAYLANNFCAEFLKKVKWEILLDMDYNNDFFSK